MHRQGHAEQSNNHCMPSVPPNPEPHPLWDVSLLLHGFQQVPQAWHFLSSASSDPSLFPHLSWVMVGRKGAESGIRASTQWLAQSSEVRKRQRAFNSFAGHLSGENSSELFCANRSPCQSLYHLLLALEDRQGSA